MEILLQHGNLFSNEILSHSNANIEKEENKTTSFQMSPDNQARFNALEPETIETPKAFPRKLNQCVLTEARLDSSFASDCWLMIFLVANSISVQAESLLGTFQRVSSRVCQREFVFLSLVSDADISI